MSKEEKIIKYTEEVYRAVQQSDGWVIKFAEWCDNGLGIGFGVELLNHDEISYYQHKYGGKVLEILEERFRQQDLQDKLGVFARGYVEKQFELGHSRLPDLQALTLKRHKQHHHFLTYSLFSFLV